MAESPQDRLRRLQELIEQKAARKKELEQAAGETEQELLEAQEQAEAEIRELQRDEEIQHLLGRMRDTAGALDRQLLADFERRGLGRRYDAEESVEESTAVERPRRERDTGERSLDTMLEDVPAGEPRIDAVYAAAERFESRQGSLYDATNPAARQGLSALEQATASGQGLSDNAYQAISRMEEAAIHGENNPYYAEDDPRRVYASQTRERIQQIKENLSLRIGDSYIDASTEDWGY